MSNNPREFKKVQDKWYEKLKDEGFQDIENTQHEERPLKKWHFNFFRNGRKSDRAMETNPAQRTLIEYRSTADFYQQASALLFTYRFENKTHKKIWELFCEGMTERHIAKKIKIYKKSTIHLVIKKISMSLKNGC